MDARALPERVAFPGGAAGRDCPACGSGATELCYAVDRIPVHSCVLPSSAEQARAFPAASMRLAWCRACGFRDSCCD